ncbi:MULTISPECIES: LacI family DNA-binding transcriptional regulator [Erwinia]|uniref:LacI family transcriptional regulator n=1 Tax=Erwinia rhapontici TaxID=55212 RepID=A0ABM7MZ27_ERWRD|nr:LacI family DNA-binding transcriptional regulator [Erwinia rhapontici]MBP2155255.1 DNA-binding LacI/PurR family transcriptional regulator [Erwinia rhapontici]MCS3605606.1 DNA-binding LacI/PurR family transcriptional regulator [Erwinia rhapontici]TDS99899.1 LacI family transcriptional regulator [Erwinia rhapontici]UDQ81974.1 LacI family DNA-binding transcriptional regulator [Erwinia rhapontici]BCQ34457.1 LacI family transcriptional regulator [Erwinia rhapontici]
MRKRRSSGRVTLQDVADYVGVGAMTVSRVMRTPELVSDSVRNKVEQAARALGYQANPEASELAAGRSDRVTLQDVARHAGIGPMTVSRALRDPSQVSEASLIKIQQAVATLGYVPNQAASTLASSQLHTVAVLYPFQHDRASTRFVQALQQTLSKQPFQLIMACHEYHQYGETPLVEKLLQNRPSALVLFGAQLSKKTCELIESAELVTVNVCGAERFSADITLDIAINDAAERLTAHLLDKGYRRIGFIGAHTDNRLHKQQLNGWHKAMLMHYQNADLMITVPDAPSLEFGRYALGQLLQNQPDLDAIICSHEEIAFGVLSECQRRLLKVPYDMAVACLDGSANCDHTFPALTSMRLNYEKLGQQVGQQLMAMLDNAPQPQEEQVRFSLEPGASS